MNLRNICNMIPSSATPRFGAYALGQQEDMWLAFGYAQISQGETSHIPKTLYATHYLNKTEVKSHGKNNSRLK